jgi:hypothetical protein
MKVTNILFLPTLSFFRTESQNRVLDLNIQPIHLIRVTLRHLSFNMEDSRAYPHFRTVHRRGRIIKIPATKMMCALLKLNMDSSHLTMKTFRRLGLLLLTRSRGIPSSSPSRSPTAPITVTSRLLLLLVQWLQQFTTMFPPQLLPMFLHSLPPSPAPLPVDTSTQSRPIPCSTPHARESNSMDLEAMKRLHLLSPAVLLLPLSQTDHTLCPMMTVTLEDTVALRVALTALRDITAARDQLGTMRLTMLALVPVLVGAGRMDSMVE